MIDIMKYVKDEEDQRFLTELRTLFVESQMPMTLICGSYSFHVDPGAGGAAIWVNNEKIAEYKTVDDMFLGFMINGKPFVERIREINYAE